MAVDTFLKLDGIPGESTDDKHKEWVECLSYSWSVSQPASASQSAKSARTTERANFADFSIVHSIDIASVKLAKACASGEHIKEVTVELCKAGGDKQKYMIYKMSDVIVSGVQPGGASGSDATPLEQVSFNYGKIEMEYIQIDAKGKPAGSVKAGWNLAANKPV